MFQTSSHNIINGNNRPFLLLSFPSWTNWKPEGEINTSLWNPHFQFSIFLILINKDYKVLLDLLISEETCFLLYFLKYLKFLISDWDVAIQSHTSHNLATLERKLRRPSGKTPHRFITKSTHRSEREDRIVDDQIPESSSSTPSSDVHDNKSVKVTLVDYDCSSDSSSTTSDTEPEKQENPITRLLHLQTCKLSTEEDDDDGFSKNVVDHDSRHTLFQLFHVYYQLSTSIENQIQKCIFPYNAKPLLKLLKQAVHYYQRHI